MALCRRRLLTTLARQVDGRSRAGMPINYGALSAPTHPAGPLSRRAAACSPFVPDPLGEAGDATRQPVLIRVGHARSGLRPEADPSRVDDRA